MLRDMLNIVTWISPIINKACVAYGFLHMIKKLVTICSFVAFCECPQGSTLFLHSFTKTSSTLVLNWSKDIQICGQHQLSNIAYIEKG